MDWFSKFDFGLYLKDKSTWTEERLPVMKNGGMIMNYCAAHEKWVWEARWYFTSCYCTSYEANFSSIVRNVSPSRSQSSGALTSFWFLLMPSISLSRAGPA